MWIFLEPFCIQQLPQPTTINYETPVISFFCT